MGCERKSPTENPGKESENPGGRTFFEMVTGSEVGSGQTGWDRFFDTPRYVFGKDPTPVLKRNVHSIRKGQALVLAVGEGRDGVFLARNGFRVTGIDISEVALRKARRLARDYGVKLNLIPGDLKFYKIQPDIYDVIVNVTYYRKGLIPAIKAGLKKGGAVVFENYTVDHLQNPGGLSVPRRFLVERNELKDLFSDFEIIEYKEENDGKEAKASLFAIKR